MTRHLSQFIWQTRYRDTDARPPESAIDDTWRRVARSAAAVEQDPAHWCERFLGILRGFHFLPGGRILAGAGTTRQVTLLNCFVMGLIDDSVEGIFEALKEGALTMQQGGGVGYDFSTLRPGGSRAHHSGMVASGPVSLMRVWDAMCATILDAAALIAAIPSGKVTEPTPAIVDRVDPASGRPRSGFHQRIVRRSSERSSASGREFNTSFRATQARRACRTPFSR
jgi:ribonucleotide reductase-like protein